MFHPQNENLRFFLLFFLRENIEGEDLETTITNLISVLIADEKVFDLIPVKKEVKAEVSGLYIVGVKGIRGSLETPAPKKKGFFARLRNK